MLNKPIEILDKDVELAAAATSHNQFIVTEQKTDKKTFSQQPVSYFTQICFERIADNLLQNLDTFITKSGKVNEDEVIEYTQKITSILWVAWVTMIAKKRTFAVKGLPKQANVPEKTPKPTEKKEDNKPSTLSELQKRFFQK